jgi:hypothetical protein
MWYEHSGDCAFAVRVTSRAQAEKALHCIETATPSMVMAQMLDCLLSTVAYMLNRAQVSTVDCLVCRWCAGKTYCVMRCTHREPVAAI